MALARLLAAGRRKHLALTLAVAAIPLHNLVDFTMYTPEVLLPWAVLTGHEKEWAKELGEFYAEGQSPVWFSSNQPFSVAAFSAGVSSVSSTLSSSYSGSSSSGGSSGGGSSGGGGFHRVPDRGRR